MPKCYSLSGTVACSGKAQGRAVLVVNGSMHLPPEPDEPYVIVADLTTPDLIPLLVDAAAIVTDIGGLSSHAANISRELGIPCIVSTMYASRRINDGDLVSVDADQNFVTWVPVADRCLFCSKCPVAHVLSSTSFYAMYDGFPVRLGHLLLVPYRHVHHISDLTVEEWADLFTLLVKAEALLTSQYEADGFNVGINDGVAAGQTVPHLHLHVIPRRAGDTPDPRGGIRNYLSNPLAEYPCDPE